MYKSFEEEDSRTSRWPYSRPNSEYIIHDLDDKLLYVKQLRKKHYLIEKKNPAGIL